MDEETNSHYWDPDKALQSLAMESSLDESEADSARRILKEGLIIAAQSIVHIATFDANSKLRFDAARYVVERNLGRLADVNNLEDDDPLDAFLRDVVKGVTVNES